MTDSAPPPETAMSHRIALADLRGDTRRHEGTASPEARAALATRFDLPSVESLHWEVKSAPWRGGVRLTGRIRASVVQECVVTLDPVPAEVDEEFDRGFVPFGDLYSEDKPGSEHEIVADRELGDIPEALTDPLDIGEIVAEEFGVALDPYPRKPGLDDTGYTSQPAGVPPLTDADVKPFAGLADLAKKMNMPEKGD